MTKRMAVHLITGEVLRGVEADTEDISEEDYKEALDILNEMAESSKGWRLTMKIDGNDVIIPGRSVLYMAFEEVQP